MNQHHLQLIPKLFLAIFPVIFLLGCGNSTEQTDKLLGSWIRSDGNYTIEITEFRPDNKLVAFYFNPNPINVGVAKWEIKNENVEIYVEMNDVNYKGSNYQLTFNEKTDNLVGFYYQAASKQTFQVHFNRKK